MIQFNPKSHLERSLAASMVVSVIVSPRSTGLHSHIHHHRTALVPELQHDRSVSHLSSWIRQIDCFLITSAVQGFGSEEEDEEEKEKEAEPTKSTQKSKKDHGKLGKGKIKRDMNLLAGKTVVLTGALSTRRADMVRILKHAGAKICSAVSKNTDILIAGDKVWLFLYCAILLSLIISNLSYVNLLKPGSKLTKAEELGVAIWQEEEVIQSLDLKSF